jgi:hypothetical protein
MLIGMLVEVFVTISDELVISDINKGYYSSLFFPPNRTEFKRRIRIYFVKKKVNMHGIYTKGNNSQLFDYISCGKSADIVANGLLESGRTRKEN